MEKSFDIKNLTERLKSKGLDVAEELAKVVAGETMDWIKESVEIHPNMYVKFLAPLIGTLKPQVMSQVDKIDGQVG